MSEVAVAKEVGTSRHVTFSLDSIKRGGYAPSVIVQLATAFRRRTLHLVVLAVAAGCGGGEARTAVPARPAPKTNAAVSAPPAASSNARNAAPTEPTARTEAEMARDARTAAKVASIIDAFSSYGARLSPDGKKLVFLSDRGGVPEIYVADPNLPSRPPEKIVNGPERASNATWSQDGKWIVFRRDHGGDENYRLYRVRPDGRELAEITAGDTLHRDEALLPRSKPDVVVFTARNTASPELGTTVNVASVAGKSSRVLFKDPGESSAVDVSPDGARALLIRFVSPTNQILFEIDLTSGSAKRVYPLEGKAAGVAAAKYSADGKQIVLGTDEGAERTVVLALDVAAYRETARHVVERPTTAGIADLAVSPRGDRIAIAIDAGNHSELRLLDAGAERLARPSPAVGSSRREPPRTSHSGRVHGRRERGALARTPREPRRVRSAHSPLPRRPPRTWFSRSGDPVTLHWRTGPRT